MHIIFFSNVRMSNCEGCARLCGVYFLLRHWEHDYEILSFLFCKVFACCLSLHISVPNLHTFCRFTNSCMLFFSFMYIFIALEQMSSFFVDWQMLILKNIYVRQVLLYEPIKCISQKPILLIYLLPHDYQVNALGQLNILCVIKIHCCVHI